jgi:hypothetical protein
MKEGGRLKEFENRVLRKILVLKRGVEKTT